MRIDSVRALLEGGIWPTPRFSVHPLTRAAPPEHFCHRDVRPMATRLGALPRTTAETKSRQKGLRMMFSKAGDGPTRGASLALSGVRARTHAPTEPHRRGAPGGQRRMSGNECVLMYMLVQAQSREFHGVYGAYGVYKRGTCRTQQRQSPRCRPAVGRRGRKGAQMEMRNVSRC